MAGTSLLTLLDDIASVLDDIALLTKAAARKTSGVLGDDLALNAEQVSGVRADRELPVVWAVAKGSLRNKLILVPAALLLSAFLPWLITPLLMIGGAYLCYEGFEKVAHKFFCNQAAEAERRSEIVNALIDTDIDMVEFEKAKIKGAIKTDFILSAEIIVIALGTVKDAVFMTQVAVVTMIALLMTVGVYALVAGIVKLDDAGLLLLKNKTHDVMGKLKQKAGRTILYLAPYLMKTLSIVGTIAMFIVGGGILIHGLPVLQDIFHPLSEILQSVPVAGSVLASIAPVFINILVGIILGGAVVGLLNLGRLMFYRGRRA